MRVGTMAIMTGLAGLLFACGGGSSNHPGDIAEPAPCPECSDPDEARASGGDDVLIPEEKYEEISALFDRKTGSISRCYVEGFEAGQVDKNKKGGVTVGLLIMPDGSSTSVRILKTSFGSPALEQCVLDLVKGWKFPTLPKALETSHTYVLDRL